MLPPLLEELTRLVHELHADGVEYDLLVRREALDGAMAAATRCGFVLLDVQSLREIDR